MRAWSFILCTSAAFAAASCAPPADRGVRVIVTPEPRAEPDDALGVYTQNGRPLLWAAADLPVTFAFDRGTPGFLRQACARAAATFNAAAGRPLIRFTDRDVVGRPGPAAPGASNVVSFGLEPATRDDEVGVCHSTFSGGRIVAAHVDFKRRTGVEDAESACLHELGHALGLTHQSSPLSIMFPYETPPYLKLTLSDGDRARVRRYYAGG